MSALAARDTRSGCFAPSTAVAASGRRRRAWCSTTRLASLASSGWNCGCWISTTRRLPAIAGAGSWKWRASRSSWARRRHGTLSWRYAEKMSWSREYARNLLHDPDPIKAVFALADVWNSRPGRKETDPFFGLLPCQYAVNLYLNYQGDVGNGGHAQFFMNPVGAYTDETLLALKELGFQQIHDVLARAVAAFPESQVPKAGKARNDLVEGFSEDVFELWSRLDRELHMLTSAHWPLLQKYLQDHESDILRSAARD